MLDVNEVRAMERSNMVDLDGLQRKTMAETRLLLSWYHATLNLVLAEVERLQKEQSCTTSS